MLRALALSLVVGCVSQADRSNLPCRPGFARAADGHCYPPPPDPDPPTANEVLEGIGPCVLLKEGAEIDLELGCIEGACAGGRFEDVDAALGGEAECALTSSGTDWSCLWPQAVEGLFPSDPDDEGAPLPGSRTPWIRGRTDYEGATPTGLGLDVSPRCFVDALGTPSYVIFVDVAGTLQPVELFWGDYGVEIEDEERVTGESFPDGIVDEITLFGPQ